MVDTRRERNCNFIAWRPVAAGESSLYTPNVRLVEYGITESTEWPPEEDIFSRAELARTTPPNAELRALAVEFPPPQAWFDDEGDVPF